MDNHEREQHEDPIEDFCLYLEKAGLLPSDSDEIVILDEEKYKLLAQEKVEARQKLLEIPPQQAQELVNNILFPELWDIDLKNINWSDRLAIPCEDDNEDDEDDDY
jgi:hypothetical protein